MLKPGDDIIRSIINLENNHSWKAVVEWLNNSMLAQSIKNNHSQGDDTIRGQGRALELEEIIKYVNKAHEYVIKK